MSWTLQTLHTPVCVCSRSFYSFFSSWGLHIWWYSAATYHHWRTDIFSPMLALKLSSDLFPFHGFSIRKILAYTCLWENLDVHWGTQFQQSHCLKENTFPFWEWCPWDFTAKALWAPTGFCWDRNSPFRAFHVDIFSSHWFSVETIHRAPLFLSFMCSQKLLYWAWKGKNVLQETLNDMNIDPLDFCGTPKALSN